MDRLFFIPRLSAASGWRTRLFTITRVSPGLDTLRPRLICWHTREINHIMRSGKERLTPVPPLATDAMRRIDDHEEVYSENLLCRGMRPNEPRPQYV